jgi:serine protease Do
MSPNSFFLPLPVVLVTALVSCTPADGHDTSQPDGRPAVVATQPALRAAPTQDSALIRTAGQEVDASRRTAIVQAATRVSPAVVTVNTRRTERVRPRTMFESFFLPPGAARRVSGLGSGFVIDGREGIVLTNHHVVEGADSVMVTFPDGRDLRATVVGGDPVTDVAVLRVATDAPLPEAPLGTSQGLLIGEWVVAIGNPFGYLLSNSEPTVTTGVVSAVGRHIVPSSDDEGFYLGMIQTDASINPGNSGGPLVNVLGEVIGVNASIFSRSGGSEGLGFAIPIDRALRVARDLLADGEVRRAWLGMDVEGAEADAWGRSRGVMVARIVGGSPAQQAGLRPGRMILEADGRRLAAPLDWEDLLLDVRPGDRLTLVLEGGSTVQLVAGISPSLTAERVRALQDLELITLTPQVRAERAVASEQGALIVGVGEALAAQLGFQAGDVIVQINDTAVRTAEEAATLLNRLQPGRVRIVIERRGSYSFRDFIWRGT